MCPLLLMRGLWEVSAYWKKILCGVSYEKLPGQQLDLCLQEVFASGDSWNFFLDNFFCLSGSKSVLGCYGRITCSPKCSTFKVQCASVTSLLWEKRHLCFHFVFITKYIANLCTIKMYVHVHLSWSTVFMKEICCYDYIVLL